MANRASRPGPTRVSVRLKETADLNLTQASSSNVVATFPPSPEESR